MEAGTPTGGNAELEHPSVLVADDDAQNRRAVRAALEKHGFVVVGETGDAASAIGAATRLRPDICLIEIELPGDGLNAVGRIAKASPNTLVIILSESERPENVVGAFTRGASGYLLKGISGERLASTLRGAYSGEPPLSRSLVPHLVDEIRRGSVRRLTLPGGPVTLTPREWEVGELLRDGHSTTEIAERLGVSPVTVRRHVGLLLHKLGAKNRETGVELLRAYSRR
ncbi:MAG TPA: response regulator transcription factor [Thermoleophilaceae bacterium]|nr:response regulator transcription factor [Thermoleophilaceae bacterium]